MSKMIEVKTAELLPPALDWAVAHATKAWKWAHEWFPTMTLDPTFLGVSDNAPRGSVSLVPRNPMRQDSQPFNPSTDWAQGGQLIDKYQIDLTFERKGLVYAYSCKDDGLPVITTQDECGSSGPTYLIAACRAIVKANLGDTVQVSAELLEVANG